MRQSGHSELRKSREEKRSEGENGGLVEVYGSNLNPSMKPMHVGTYMRTSFFHKKAGENRLLGAKERASGHVGLSLTKWAPAIRCPEIRAAQFLILPSSLSPEVVISDHGEA